MNLHLRKRKIGACSGAPGLGRGQITKGLIDHLSVCIPQRKVTMVLNREKHNPIRTFIEALQVQHGN